MVSIQLHNWVIWFYASWRVYCDSEGGISFYSCGVGSDSILLLQRLPGALLLIAFKSAFLTTKRGNHFNLMWEPCTSPGKWNSHVPWHHKRYLDGWKYEMPKSVISPHCRASPSEPLPPPVRNIASQWWGLSFLGHLKWYCSLKSIAWQRRLWATLGDFRRLKAT